MYKRLRERFHCINNSRDGLLDLGWAGVHAQEEPDVVVHRHGEEGNDVAVVAIGMGVE